MKSKPYNSPFTATPHSTPGYIDEALASYYEACRNEESGSSDSSDEPHNGVLAAGVSVWRATSGDSPLRGRARLSLHHRNSIQQLRNGLDTSTSVGVTDPSALRNHRGVGAQQVASKLALQLETALPSLSPVLATTALLPGGVVRYAPQADLQRAQLEQAEARRQAVLFDVLCALRQSASTCCVYVVPTASSQVKGGDGRRVSPGYWELQSHTAREVNDKGWLGLQTVVLSILGTATQIAELQSELDEFCQAIQRMSTVIDISDMVGDALMGESMPGTYTPALRALGAAAFGALLRFSLNVRNLLRDFKKWVLDVQEHQTVLFRRRRRRSQIAGYSGVGGNATYGDGCKPPRAPPLPVNTTYFAPARVAAVGRKVRRGERSTTEGNDDDLHSGNDMYVETEENDDEEDGTGYVKLLEAIQHNVQSLLRCLVIVQETQCFGRVAEWCLEMATPHDNAEHTSQQPVIPTANAFAELCAENASHLLDFLIVRASALQDTSAMDLYRCYMMYLVHCSWPYVLLMTSCIFGFVIGVDPKLWRQLLPRIFRSSFSHIRVSSPHASCPTDVLSLVLNCIGYHRSGREDTTDDAAGPEHDVCYATRTHRGADLSAMLSARSFILRSFAAFARMKRQNRAKRLSTCPNTQVNVVSTSTQETTTGLRPLRDKKMGDILRELLHDGSEESEKLYSYLPENRKRLYQRGAAIGLQMAATSESGAVTFTVRHYPTMLPLGFSTMEKTAYGERRPLSQSRDVDDNKNPDTSIGSVWCLRTADGRVTHDVLLVDCFADEDEGYRYSAHHNRSHGIHQADQVHPRNNRPPGNVLDGSSDLWLNTAIPAARWITAALLLPIGGVVQRLQDRRLRNLLAPSPLRGFLSGLPQRASMDDCPMEEGNIFFHSSLDSLVSRSLAAEYADRRHPRQQLSLCETITCFPASFSFAHAVGLLLDVALCRDSERLVDRFIIRLHNEPGWWHRRDVREFDAVGTASMFISSTFSDAIRDKRFSELVRLCVLPKNSTASPPKGSASNAEETYAHEMLDTFASFQLHFSFPDELSLVLLPRDLCVYLQNASASVSKDTIVDNYTAFFWQKRRQLAQQAGNAVCVATPRNFHGFAGCEHAIHFADVWSYVFGYHCSLHLARVTLLGKQKLLQRRGVESRELLGTLGMGPQPTRCIYHVSRGLGSAYYALTFAVNALLTFNQNEVCIVAHRMENLLSQGEGITSGVQLCQQLDHLLLQLQLVSYPTKEPVCTNARQQAAFTNASRAVRDCITSVLELALDTSALPVKLVTARTRNAIEAMVASLRGPGMLGMRLQPLLTLLTFNRYYGGEDEISFQFR